MIAIDTNLLVYAHRMDMAFHKKADQFLTELFESNIPVAIPTPCISEFLSIVTNSKIFKEPSPREIAFQEIENILALEHITVIGELTGFLSILKKISTKAKISGGQFHDARIMSICLQHEISILYSADRDFNRFSGVKIKNPLV